MANFIEKGNEILCSALNMEYVVNLPISKYSRETNTRDFMNEGFTWIDTGQGHAYWSHINALTWEL